MPLTSAAAPEVGHSLGLVSADTPGFRFTLDAVEPPWNDDARVAVIPPRLDEATAVGHMIEEVPAALPGATVYVYDDRSTAAAARAHGAQVRHELDNVAQL